MGSAATLVYVWVIAKFASSSKNGTKETTIRNDASGSNKNVIASREIPPEIREEQLSRHTLYFGQDGMKSLKESSIVVVGVGGVGSHVAHMVSQLSFL